MHAVCTKGGKMHASESRLVSGLLLIGWENGATFLSQSLKGEQMQITFDTHVKTALIWIQSTFKYYCYGVNTELLTRHDIFTTFILLWV